VELRLSLGKVFGHLGRARFFIRLPTILVDSLGGLQGGLLQPPLFSPRLTTGNDLLGICVGKQCLGNLLNRETGSKVDNHRSGQLGSELEGHVTRR
jgi:hypothetical protein